MRVAERHAFPYESLRGIGREQQRIRRSGSETTAIELEPGDEHAERGKQRDCDRELAPHTAKIGSEPGALESGG